MEYYLHVWPSIIQKMNKTKKLYMDETVKYSEDVTLDIPSGLSHYLLLLNDHVLDIACATFSVIYHEDYSNGSD